MPVNNASRAYEARARTLLNQAIETNHQAMAALLSEHGFAQSGERMVQHPTTGVTLATHRNGYRITFYCEHADNCMGIVDLPTGTTYGLVEYVTVALHAALTTEPS